VPPPPWTPRSGKILTYAEVLAYAFVTVKFQLRSSINVRLTESSLSLKGPPKWGFGGNFGGRGKDI